MMKKEQYIIEREYLGVTSVKEFMGAIIKIHNENSCECKNSDCVKTVGKSIDL